MPEVYEISRKTAVDLLVFGGNSRASSKDNEGLSKSIKSLVDLLDPGDAPTDEELAKEMIRVLAAIEEGRTFKVLDDTPSAVAADPIQETDSTVSTQPLVVDELVPVPEAIAQTAEILTAQPAEETLAPPEVVEARIEAAVAVAEAAGVPVVRDTFPDEIVFPDASEIVPKAPPMPQEPEEPPVKKKVGRPKGSKNAPKDPNEPPKAPRVPREPRPPKEPVEKAWRPTRIRLAETREWVAGQVLKAHSLKDGVTDEMVAEMNAAYGVENEQRSIESLVHAWHAINGYTGELAVKPQKRSGKRVKAEETNAPQLPFENPTESAQTPEAPASV